MFLDAGAAVAKHGPAALRELMSEGSDSADRGPLVESLNGLARSATDWNAALEVGNQWYDRLVAAANEPDPAIRRQALTAIDAELAAVRVTRAPLWADLLRPRAELGRRVGQQLAAFLLPAVSSALDAEQRTAATLDLTRLALALAAYRAEHAEYPDTLDQLVPTDIETVPRDRFTAGPLVYRRTGEGYLLYSVGPNGQDDGGRGQTEQLAGDDVSVRAPPEAAE
jgi:hypothetical protein